MKQERLFSPRYLAVCAAIFASGYGLYILNAMVPLYVTSVGGNATYSGVLNTCFTVCACVARLLGGTCSDRFGRRRVILAGACFLTVGLLAYTTVSSFPLLMLFRGVQGIGYAAMSVGASSAVVDVLPESRLGEGIGISALFNTLASCIAPTIGVAIATGFDYRVMFISTAAVAACGLLSTVLFLNYEDRAALKARRQAAGSFSLLDFAKGLFEREAIPLAMVYCVFLVGNSMTYVFMTLFGVSSGFAHPGAFFMAAAVSQVFARILAGRAADHGHTFFVVMLGTGAGILVYLLLALFPTEPMYILSGLLFGVDMGLVAPVLNRLAVAGVAPDRRGAATATFYLAADVGNGIGGMLWGVVIDSLGYTPGFFLVSAWMLVSLLLLAVYLLRRSRREGRAL